MPAALNSVPKGSTDVWPVLRIEPEELAKQVRAGDHDGILSELEEMESGHGKRDLVLAACKARLVAAAAKPSKPAKD